MATRGRSGLRRPTVADVARLAGVSPMTVSRVVNGEPSVIAATRDKVQAAIADLGYVPNAAARSLAAGKQCRIALAYSNPSTAYLSELLIGCLSEAGLRDVELTIEHSHAGDSAEGLVARLRAHRIDAALLPSPLCDDTALLAALSGAQIPVAQIGTARPLDAAHAVMIDEEAAAFAMTRHLLSRGHRRIGFIAGDPKQTASALRQRGYERALVEAGLAPRAELRRAGAFTYRSGLEAAAQLLELDPRPTAIFASNDDMAAAAAAVAHRRGLDVPRDVSIVGFDDTPIATTVWPELTTVRQPIQGMAQLAIDLLVDAVRRRRLGERPAMRHEFLAYELILRESDATANTH